jgi:hypothetical protein
MSIPVLVVLVRLLELKILVKVKILRLTKNYKI